MSKVYFRYKTGVVLSYDQADEASMQKSIDWEQVTATEWNEYRNKVEGTEIKPSRKPAKKPSKPVKPTKPVQIPSLLKGKTKKGTE